MNNVSDNVMVGGWTTYSTKISGEEIKIFKAAVDLVGVSYTPFAVSTQVVAGTNYRFLCNAKGAYPNAPEQLALVQIYAPLNGEPHVTSIQMITEPSGEFGGWSPFSTEISGEETKVFNESVQLLGVKYTPFAVSTQVVEGTNYRFLCNAQAVYPNAPNQLALIQINAPLGGKPHVTSIRIVE